MMGCAFTWETCPLTGYPPHKRTTPLMGLLPRWRYQIVDRVGPLIWDRRIQPVDGLYPPLQTNFCRLNQTMTIYKYRYIYEGFLVWIIPSTYQLRMVIASIILPRMRSYRHAFLMTRISGMISKFEYALSVWGQLGLYICSDNGDMRYKVYIWEFSYLNYSLDVIFSEIRKLSSYN